MSKKKLLQFKIIGLVNDYTKYGQDFISTVAFSYIPDLRKLSIGSITENGLYKLIGLTEGEIAKITKNS